MLEIHFILLRFRQLQDHHVVYTFPFNIVHSLLVAYKSLTHLSRCHTNGAFDSLLLSRGLNFQVTSVCKLQNDFHPPPQEIVLSSNSPFCVHCMENLNKCDRSKKFCKKEFAVNPNHWHVASCLFCSSVPETIWKVVQFCVRFSQPLHPHPPTVPTSRFFISRSISFVILSRFPVSTSQMGIPVYSLLHTAVPSTYHYLKESLMPRC